MPRSKSSQKWLKQHRNDPYVQQAKQEGLRGRAIYKLQDIDQKYGFIKPNSTILDLGSAPGSWSQYLSKTYANCKLVACDLLVMPAIPNVHFVQGDFTDPACQQAILSHLSHIDLIVCDMAPNATGQSKVDQWQAGALTEAVFLFCSMQLREEGQLLIKLFHGSEFEGHLKWLRQHFKKVTIYKPSASRTQSRETYALAQNFMLVQPH
jgi:23S rRNA (uridine2552-2'-O)-methyltransferase